MTNINNLSQEEIEKKIDDVVVEADKVAEMFGLSNASGLRFLVWRHIATANQLNNLISLSLHRKLGDISEEKYNEFVWELMFK